MNINQKEESKNVKESLLNLQKIVSSNKMLDSLLTKCLLIEYKYLQKFCPSGIYILPQFDEIKIWHGVIFVREGYYKEGIFKFEIHIPQNYPSKPPEIQFTTKIFHPLVDISSGKLDLSKKFLNWEIGKNFIVQILYFIQNLFYEVSYLQDTNSFNPTAANLFNENPKKFEEEVSKYSKKSFEERFENRNNNSSIKFSKHNAKYHQIILDKILKQNKEVSFLFTKVETYDRIEDFKNWFMNNFMELIQNENNAFNNNLK